MQSSKFYYMSSSQKSVYNHANRYIDRYTGYQPCNSSIEIHNMHFGDAAAGSGTCCMQETSKQVGGCIPYPSSSDFSESENARARTHLHFFGCCFRKHISALGYILSSR